MNTDFRARLVERLGPDAGLTDRELEQLWEYFALLVRWNERINLTALPLAGFPAETLDRLLVEPIAAARELPNEPRFWLDLGSGGGSPAVPLKILRPKTRLTMIESRGRKAAFLREVARALDLESTTVLEDRFEVLAAADRPSMNLDVLTIRAVKVDTRLAQHLRHSLASGGRLLIFRSTPVGSVQPWAGLRLLKIAELLPTSAVLEVFEAV